MKKYNFRPLRLNVHQSIVLATLSVFFLVVPATHAQGVLFVNNDRVGIGTDTPDRELHVTGTGGVNLKVEDPASGAGFILSGNGYDFQFLAASNGDIRIRSLTGIGEIKLDTSTGFWGINQTNPQAQLEVGGDAIIRGNLDVTGSVTEGSSQTIKHGFEFVDSALILSKVMELPVLNWSYDNAPDVTHIGPVAEDFFQLFGLGDSSSHIATVDRDGVALAAIQGLKDEKDAEIKALKNEIREIREQIEAIQAAMNAD